MGQRTANDIDNLAMVIAPGLAELGRQIAPRRRAGFNVAVNPPATIIVGSIHFIFHHLGSAPS
jgi:hypothetical protein